MFNAPEPHSKFVVTSGCLCYGALHNLVHGASSHVQGFSTIRPERSETVLMHRLEYNISAKNGTWNAYHLVETRSRTVAAWFVCHSDVDSGAEIDKILRVSGSPYDSDSGSSTNNSKTEEEGVFVINRYDWGWYDKRAIDMVHPGEWPNCVGLADYKSAKEDVNEWRELPSHGRGTRPGAVWLHIPEAEYMFGRFGFDEDHREARSFTFFTTITDFTSTSFAGLDTTLRKFETHEERFERRLREGFDFEGLETLTMMHKQFADFSRFSAQLLPESDRMGPFEDHESILLIADLEAIGASRNSFGLAEPWKERLCMLLNEMMMSYLAQFIVPTASFATVQVAADSVFPNRSRGGTVDHYLHRFWISPWSQADAIPNLDILGLENRVKGFLISYCGGERLVTDGRYISGVARGINWLAAEILELCSNTAIDNYRNRIVPADVRIAVHNDDQILTLIGSSRVSWSGSGQTP